MIEEPLGLMYIAACLEAKGHNVRVIDAQGVGWGAEEILQSVAEIPDIVGITADTPSVLEAYQIAGRLKQSFPSTPVIYGGVHPTFLPEEALTQGKGDIVVLGEGEITMTKLLDFYIQKRSLSNPVSVRGIAYRLNGELKKTQPRESISDLDGIPFPARHLFPMEKYNTTIHHPDAGRAAGLIASRGCPGNCIFCSSPALYHRKVRFRSSTNVISEINDVTKRYGIKTFHFYDDCFTVRRKWVIDFCKGVLEANLEIEWCCLAKINHLDRDLLQIMKKAGCTVIELGIESGDQRILDLVRKGISIEQINRVVEMVLKTGITPQFLFMRGNIGETPESLNKTYEMAIKFMVSAKLHGLKHSTVIFQNAIPYPGSEFNEIARGFGKVLTKKWSNYITLSAIFVPKDLDLSYLQFDPYKYVLSESALRLMKIANKKKEAHSDAHPKNA
jgi:anaerobic magnesium-protoporphyrin IX monomethyl ester cyclase